MTARNSREGATMRGMLSVAGAAVAAVATLSALARPAAEEGGKSDQVALEQTYYHDGNLGTAVDPPSSIDVDADGTVAVAVNSDVGPGNRPTSRRALLLLFDKDGEPLGETRSPNSGMNGVRFGPDGRVYTAEFWFGSGVHVYDRPGVRPRRVPQRLLKADGSHPDIGAPAAVAVGPDYRVYTVFSKDHKVYVTSPEDKRLQVVDGSGFDEIHVAPDGTVYSGDKVLQADGTWKPFPYHVRDVRPDGKLLVSDRDGWGIYDPAAAKLDRRVQLPPGDWAGAALGPDDRLYLTPRKDPGLAYVVADAEGKIVLRRGADFERLKATLPAGRLTAGGMVTLSAETVSSRALGYVPASRQLPQDHRLPPRLTASLAPAGADPLGQPTWQPVTLAPGEGGQYQLRLPADATGEYVLRLAATPTDVPGLRPLAVESRVTVLPEGTRAWLVPATDRGRTGFVAGRPVRLTVPVRPDANVDLGGVRLTLALGDAVAWQAPLGLAAVPAGLARTAVIVVPAEVTGRLRPGVYTAALTGLPPGVYGGKAVIALADPVPVTRFQTPLHPIGPSYTDPVPDARLHAELGATHVVSPVQWDGTYLDVLDREGMTFHYQPYAHYAPLNTLPQEQGALRQAAAGLAQRLRPYPAFRGFNYHDLQVQPWGGYADAPRKPFYPKLWDDLVKPADVPGTVPEAGRKEWATHLAMQRMHRRVLDSLGTAVRQVDDGLERTAMPWWSWAWAGSPDQLDDSLSLVSAQHMQEQFYHPLSVANQADLWRRPGKPLWVYGNTTWQEDGTGASMYRDFMTALSRGAQGVGRNELPRTGTLATELGSRTMAAGFRLLHVYGGLSAASEPDDEVAVWRSFFQEASEGDERQNFRRHFHQTTRAYAACLYAHRTAAVVTDDLVRAGALKKYHALLISCEMPPPPDLQARLKEFQEGGGLVLANRPHDGYWHPPGAVELGEAFGESRALANLDTETHQGTEEDGRDDAARVLKALGKRVQPLADCDDPTTWLSVLRSGAARYVYAVNLKRLPHRPTDLHRFSGYENTGMPTRTPLLLKPGRYAIYDVLAGKRVEPVLRRDRWSVTADLSVFPGAILALLPAPVEGVQLAAGLSADRARLAVQARVTDDKERTLDAAVPLEVTVRDAAGGTRYHLYRTAVHGLWEETLPVAANDRGGRWTVRVAELLSGRQSSGGIEVAPPALPEAAPVPVVEWSDAGRVEGALKAARRVAVVVEDRQAEPLAAAVKEVTDGLAAKGKEVVRLRTEDYLADRKELGWDRFNARDLGALGTADLKPRPRKYDLVVTFDTPDLPGGVVPADVLPVRLTAADPGPGRGLVQYAVMPAYDTEDAVALAGGDAEGVRAAAKALAGGSATAKGREDTERGAEVPMQPLAANRETIPPAGLRQFVGVPISELAVTPDGQRIAVGMKGWGNNFFVLDAEGKVHGKSPAGKFFPVELQALQDGFTVVEHENDPTTLYLKIYDRDGHARLRLAAAGRRVGGVRDWSPSLPTIMPTFLAQASFSVTPDGHWAAVGGSKAAAVWDLSRRQVVWRDDGIHYAAPAAQNTRDPREFADSFPQLRLAPDGKAVGLRHNRTVQLRDLPGGAPRAGRELPEGTVPGRVRVCDGHVLVVGDDEFFAYRDGEPQWHWKAPGAVTASAFAPDGLHYAVAEADGALRLMEGGGQVGGWLAPDGAVTSLALLSDARAVAFATTTGRVGVVDFRGTVRWRQDVGTRAVIAFLGTAGDTVVGDGRGILRRFNPEGKQVWEVDLTPQVWRADTAARLAANDATPTLRLPPPRRAAPAPPAGRTNLARSAMVQFLPPRGWFGQLAVPRPVSVNDGKKVSPKDGWFRDVDLEFAAFVPSPPAWELEWPKAVTLNTVVVDESPRHPEAVPEEVRIEAWVDGDWKEVVHDFWNRGVAHVHRFANVTTTRVRYTPLGDLANNVWVAEIEAYQVP